MTSVHTLFEELSRTGVRVRLDGGRLVCRAAPGALTPALQERLRLHKAELVTVLAEMGRGVAAQPILPAPRRGGSGLPMSFAQRRLWVYGQMEGPSSVYNIPLALAIEGPLDPEAMRLAIGALVERHESLRTTFGLEGDAHVQIVHSADAMIEAIWRREAFETRPGESIEDAALRIADGEASAPFDLSAGPLLRVRLLQAGGARWLLLLTMHHIISDGWSMGILLRELGAFYLAFSRGEPEPLAPLLVQYADYARWQRDWLEGRVLKEQLSWWTERLAGVPEVIDLPCDRPRRPQRSHHGGLCTFSVRPGTARKLKELGRRVGSTTFATLLAAFAVLLRRWAGVEDFIIGSPVANRNRTEIEGLIGFFINMLCLRMDLSDSPAFAGLLERVRDVALDAHSHQDLPFERLVEALNPRRDLSYTPLIQVVLVFQSAGDAPTLSLPGLSLSSLRPDVIGAKFDLVAIFEEREDGLLGRFQYASDLFDRETMELQAARFVALLDSIAADPEQPIMSLPLIVFTEQARIAVWNDTAKRFEGPPFLDERVAAWARMSPGRLAVDLLTFGMLDSRASDLAACLASRGVGPGNIVGVLIPPSPEMVLAQLAVLKAGAAFLSLDASHPAERLRVIVCDASAKCVLISAAGEGADALRGLGIDLLRVDEPRPSAKPPVARRSPEDPAYVIYTSGSTGVPNGVVVPHRGLANLVDWHRGAFGITPADRSSQVASPGFDASVWEIWGCLANGASLSIAERSLLLSPEALRDWFLEQRVTVAFLPTPLAQELLKLEWPASAPLRALLVGGEQLRHIPRVGLSFALYNNYGPTECSVVATSLRVDPGGEGKPSIGRPIDNIQAHVLDEVGNPLPAGIAGELWLGGVGLALGYLNRPELNARRFVVRDGERLYRTGDRVRWRRDGCLEFLGRVDHQIKMRGFRIETCEVESCLQTHPEVSEAVVAARGEDALRRLYAWVVPVAGRSPTPNALAEWLRRSLPEYMVPSAIAVLPAFPLTRNGKVDRDALPKPVSPEASFEAPRSPVETILAEVWAGVLGLERVGLRDNFFELGGDSILSIQIVAAAGQRGLKITARDLFKNQTVEKLAQVAQSVGASTPSGAGDAEGEAPMTPIQRRFFADELADPQHFNHAYLFVTVPELDAAMLRGALARLLAHHEGLRARFPLRDGRRVQVTRDADDFALPFVTAPLSELGRVAEELQRGFDLEKGPLLRVAFFAGQPRMPGRLLFIPHHLVVDGVSWRILLGDFASLCQAAQKGGNPILPAPTTSLRHWGRRLEEWAGAMPADECRYWRDLAAGPTPLRLPFDLTRDPEANTVASQAVVQTVLPVEITGTLLRDAPRVLRLHVNEVLVAALAAALGEWACRGRVLVDLEGHGRSDHFEDVDLSRTIGWFTALHPVALEARPAQAREDWIALLKSTKQTLRSVPHGGIGFGVLRYLAADAVLAAMPAPEISFNYLGQYDHVPLGYPFARIAAEPSGPPLSERQRRGHLLIVSGHVSNGRLAMTWSYSRAVHRAESMRALAEGFERALRSIAGLCADESLACLVPAEVPFAGLGQEELDRVLQCLSATGTAPCLVEDLYPLTPLQQGMLFHHLAAPGAGHYLEVLALTFSGSLDEARLRDSWRRVVERHTILRSRAVWESGHAMQAVLGRFDPEWAREDWTGLSPNEQEDRLRALRSQEQARGFRLDREVPLRFRLVLRGGGRCTLLWCFHHILLDGWSTSIILRDLLRLYAGETLMPAARPYRDFVEWLRLRPRGDAESFWRSELAGIDEPTPMIMEPGQPGNSESGEQRFALSEGATSELQALARRCKVTVSVLVQAAWALLLGLYSRKPRVLFGVTVSGRSEALPDMEGRVGLFINSVPVRIDMEPDRNIGEWLSSLHDRQIERGLWSHVCLSDIQGWSEIPRGTPLFNSLVVFENYPSFASQGDTGAEALRLEGIEAREMTEYPLTLIAGVSRALTGRLYYDRTRFSASAIRRMADQFENLLAALTRSEGLRLHDLPLLGEKERGQIAVWNSVTADWTKQGLFPERFLAAAARRPNALALACGEMRLTYAQLRDRAESLARVLAAHGVGPEVRVGVYLNRSVELVVGLLGILLAGGTYVPLDPSYPDDRVAAMLDDPGLALVLTRGPLTDQLRRFSSLPPLDLDNPSSFDPPPQGTGTTEMRIARGPTPEPPTSDLRLLTADSQQPTTDSRQPTALSPSKLAYVMYTSGSTGRPKGVSITHGNLASLIQASEDTFPDEYLKVMLACSSICFDMSVFELFVPLALGKTVVLVDNALFMSQASPTPTFVTTVPSAMGELLRSGSVPDGVRVIGLAGEALKNALVQSIYESIKSVERVYNLYGPTEVTVYSAWAWVPRGADREPAIGPPVANIQAHVLDEALRPVPLGVAGELFLSGAGVGRGYLNRPDLDAERFLDNPFGTGRLFRSGDLARWRDSGELECLGRLDHQVKIRGFRIELGEVEGTLLRHPGVKLAVIVAWPDPVAGDLRLVAYVESSGVQEAELRQALRRQLPDYMVPSRFMVMEALPLTPNGKIDRKALPAPSGEPSRSAKKVDPRTPAELRLAQIWQDVLGVASVGVTESFFDLGGHSLLAVALLGRVIRACGTGVSLRDFIATPTIEHLAALVRLGGTPREWTPLVPIQPKGSRPPVFCVHPGGGAVMCYWALSRRLGEDLPFYGLQARGLEAGQQPLLSMPEMAALYLQAMRSVQPTGPYRLMGWSFGGNVAWEMSRQLLARGETVSWLGILDTLPFDAKEPLKELETCEIIQEIVGPSIPVPWLEIKTLSDEEQVTHVLQAVLAAGQLPPDMDRSQIHRLLAVIRAHGRAAYAYHASYQPIHAHLLLSHDPAMEQRLSEGDPTGGWARLCSSATTHRVPGNHYTFIEEPLVETLADILRHLLA